MENGEAVPSALLALIKSCIRTSVKGIKVFSCIRTDRRTNTCRDRADHAGQQNLFPKAGHKTLKLLFKPFPAGNIGQKYNKFISAHTPADIGAPKLIFEPFRKFLDYTVSGSMTVIVIDILKMINICHEESVTLVAFLLRSPVRGSLCAIRSIFVSCSFSAVIS